MEKVHVSVGIAAYNEESGIKKTLEQVLSQNCTNFVIDEVIVNSDGSNDRTDQIVQAFQSPLIRLLADGKRKGKGTRVNEIMVKAKSEILILLDADINMQSRNTFYELIQPICNSKDVVLTSGDIHPTKPVTTMQKLLLVGVNLWDKTIAKNYGSGAYYCSGAIRAMHHKLYKKLRFPAIKAEDVYPYLFSKKNKIGEFVFVEKASVQYTLPRSYSDYLSQMRRYLGAIQEQENFFDQDFLHEEFTITTKDKIRTLVNEFLNQPLWVMSYFVLLIVIRLNIYLFPKKQATQSGVWDAVASSK